MLELGLHSCSAMNWVSGLRFSISYLTGWFSCSSPLLPFPFRWDRQAWVIFRPVLLGFWAFIAFIVIGLLGIWTFIVYVISYLRLSDLCCYQYFQFDLWYCINFYIMIWWLLLLFRLYFDIIIILFPLLFIYLLYPEKTGCDRFHEAFRIVWTTFSTYI